VDHDHIRKCCKEEFARRYREDEEDTLVPCPGCDGAKLVRVDTDDSGQSYRMFSCPWCEGRGTTTTKMIALYRKFQRASSSGE
jgi:hypothetical protein